MDPKHQVSFDWKGKATLTKKPKVILDLCGGTGAWSRPYTENGYDVDLITLPRWDVKDYIPPRGQPIQGILAAPPCTMFSLARTTAKTPRDFKKGLIPVQQCLRIIWHARMFNGLKWWALENPKGYLRQFLGKPAMTFNPYDFGDPYSKATDLWGFFNEPKRNPVEMTDEMKSKCAINSRPLPKIKGLTQADKRAITPAGFAKAFFEANP